MTVVLGSQRRRLSHQQEGCAEYPGLLVGTLGELRAAHAAREAEVVSYARARARLPSDRLGLDREGLQPFGGRVYGRGKTRRTGTEHDHVEVATLTELRAHSIRRSELRIGGV